VGPAMTSGLRGCFSHAALAAIRRAATRERFSLSVPYPGDDSITSCYWVPDSRTCAVPSEMGVLPGAALAESPWAGPSR
jgi:hypothetical protein